jgi:PKD repeat protein
MVTANFFVTPFTGDVYATDFTFTDETSGNIVSRVWDLGDGNYKYNVTEFTHVYNYPGTYTINLTCIDNNGNSSVASNQIITDYPFRDYVSFTQIPDKYSDPGSKPTEPFRVAVVTSQLNSPLTVNLFAANSNSIPFEYVPEQWSFLVPTWRFLDSKDNFITSLSVEPVKIFKNNKQVGLSGEAEFYFIDDTSTGNPTINCPLLLAATLQTSAFNFPEDSRAFNYLSYSNSTVAQAVIVWQVNDLQPSFLKVTGNYVDEIYSRKWTNVKIPILITCHSSREFYVPGSGETDSNIIFSYPPSNSVGLSADIKLSLSGVPDSYYTVDEAPLYFQTLDKEGFKTGGYVFTTVTPLSPIASTVIQASSTVFDTTIAEGKFNFPTGHAPNPFVWIANPEQNRLNKISLVPYPSYCETIKYYKENGLLVDGYIKTYEVPSLSTTNTFNYLMSGFSGVYGIAIDPRKYDVLITDVELDRIYKYSTFGQLLCTVQLSSFGDYSPLSGAYTPSNIAIDRFYNVYVSLFNSVSVLKFDKDLSFVKAFAPSGSNIFSEFESDFLIKPPVVETDINSNVWTTYAHPLCSFMVQYNPSGVPIKQIPFNNYSVPVSLAINVDNNIWVAKSFNVTENYGAIDLYNSTTGTLMSSITGFTRPGYLHVDRNNSLWFVHDLRSIGLITETGQTFSWFVSTDGTFVPLTIPTPLSASYLRDDEQLGGLGIDVYNRLWVIDNTTNKTHLVTADPYADFSTKRTIKVLPNSVLGYRLNDDLSFSYTIEREQEYPSARAVGDWTGNKWYQKYSSALSAQPVSGISVPFTVYDFENSFQIQRINEDFNTAEYYKSLALPENLKNNTNLFDQFFSAAVGTSMPSAYEDIGQNTYERIANFVSNHADPDTCNIDQLISLASEVGLDASTYGTDFPTEIKKYLDIASIPREKLWGILSPQPILAQSVGAQLNPQTAYLTAGTKIFVKSKFDSTTSLIEVQPLTTGATIYPLSAFEGYGLIQPAPANYFFYSYSPVVSDKFIENIIDWENPYTTLNPYASTNAEWYGESGAIENVFNYLLTKNLVVK